MSISTYRASLRSIVRGLWSGALSADQFNDEMRNAINRRLSEAWDEGARECGITPVDYTEAEFLALGKAIQSELTFIGGLRQAVEENSRANGDKLTPLFVRADLWVNRYRDVKNQAKMMACKDQKLEWIYGDTRHCNTCLALNGKVKRASQWQASGIEPQRPPNNNLECGGWNCQCVLQVTDKPVSKGPLPRFRGKMIAIVGA